MDESENSDDRQTLIRAESLAGLVPGDDEASNSSSGTEHRVRRTSGHHPTAIFQQLPPICHLVCYSVVLVICTTCLVVCLPVYLNVSIFFWGI